MVEDGFCPLHPFEYEYRFTEYEYRFTEYEYRFTEYEYDEIRSDARTESTAICRAPLRHAGFLSKEPNAAHGIDFAIAYLTISETANKWVHSGELARSRKLYCGLYPTRNVVFPTWTNLAT